MFDVLLCGASPSRLSDLYLLQLRVRLFYDAEIRQNESVLSVSLRGNFEKIRIMTTFRSRVTQRGQQFEVRALYINLLYFTECKGSKPGIHNPDITWLQRLLAKGAPLGGEDDEKEKKKNFFYPFISKKK